MVTSAIDQVDQTIAARRPSPRRNDHRRRRRRAKPLQLRDAERFILRHVSVCWSCECSHWRGTNALCAEIGMAGFLLEHVAMGERLKLSVGEGRWVM